MTEEQRNDYFYLCSLIEYVGRKTMNRRSVVVNAMGEKGLTKELKDAGVNHCLTFEQVSDEVIERYHIENGSFDTITHCKYSIPGYMDIGRLYSYMIENLAEPGNEPLVMQSVFNSPISDEISDFRTGVYFENPSYLQESYKAGRLLD